MRDERRLSRTAFTFTGPRVERTLGRKLAVRHLDCGALNELAPDGASEDGHDLWKVVGEVQPMQLIRLSNCAAR